MTPGGPSAEQIMLRDSLTAWLADNYGFDERRRILASAEGWRPRCWTAFARDLGILRAALPESLGGLGGGMAETLVIMEALGAALVVEPYLSAVVIGGGFLRRSAWPAAGGLIGRIISGEAVLAFADTEEPAAPLTVRASGTEQRLAGVKTVVRAAPWASHLVATAQTDDGTGVFIVERDAPGLLLHSYATHDGQRAAQLQFDDVAALARLDAPGEGSAMVCEVLDEAVTALCAEGVGVMRRMLADTLTYARQRRQFGRPIAEFQALQHRMADMFIQIEVSAALTARAAASLEDRGSAPRAAVAAAKVQLGRACRFVGQAAVQIHGAVGLSDELAVSHYFKRATMIEVQLGTAERHLARYQDILLSDAS